MAFGTNDTRVMQQLDSKVVLRRDRTTPVRAQAQASARNTLCHYAQMKYIDDRVEDQFIVTSDATQVTVAPAALCCCAVLCCFAVCIVLLCVHCATWSGVRLWGGACTVLCYCTAALCCCAMLLCFCHAPKHTNTRTCTHPAPCSHMHTHAGHR